MLLMVGEIMTLTLTWSLVIDSTKNVQCVQVKCCAINHTRQFLELNIDKTKTTLLKATEALGQQRQQLRMDRDIMR